MPYIPLVTYRCIDAPFTCVLKNFSSSIKKIQDMGVNFRTVQGNVENFRNVRTMPRPELTRYLDY